MQGKCQRGRGCLLVGDLEALWELIPISGLLFYLCSFSFSFSLSFQLSNSCALSLLCFWTPKGPQGRRNETFPRDNWGSRRCYLGGRETESAQGLWHRPKGRGCNIPELPVESALDQVHSQAGAYEPPASGRARWPQAPLGLALLGHSSPITPKGPLRSQGNPAPGSFHSSP